MAPTTIPARSGMATILQPGQTVRVTNTHGHQVVDTWAFILSADAGADPGFDVEYMSMSHTRAGQDSIRPRVGGGLRSNRRRDILTLAADTSPGVHDTFIAACDIYRYRELIPDLQAAGKYHENCSDNLHAALAGLQDAHAGELALQVQRLRDRLRGWTPDPLNLFMNIPWAADLQGTIQWEAPVSRAGEYVDLQTVNGGKDVVVVAFSACPQDVIKINGNDPVDAAFEVF